MIENTLLEKLILGIIQGAIEWLPVSSEGFVTITAVNFFQESNILQIIQFSLFLHLGTLCSSIVYFRKRILSIWQEFVKSVSRREKLQPIVIYLSLSTLCTGIIGISLSGLLFSSFETSNISEKSFNVVIAIFLIITALISGLGSRRVGLKNINDTSAMDAIIVGIMQGFAIFPGLSRSGLTISMLLIRKFNTTAALEISFLMSMPIVFIGNVFWNFRSILFTFENLIALGVSFAVGILTIHLFLHLAKKINFTAFVAFIGILLLLSTFIH